MSQSSQSYQNSPIREAAVAGKFYPEDSKQLLTMIQSFMNNIKQKIDYIPKIIVVPHAGYQYSGQVAADGYAILSRLRGIVRRVIILGPPHRCAVNGFALPSAEFFATPFGKLVVDHALIEKLVKYNHFKVNDKAFDGEHCIEVQLPFIQSLLGQVSIVPILVAAQAKDVAELIAAIWGGQETLFVISTDLSHFLQYNEAQRLDQITAQAIVDLNPQYISQKQACGGLGLCGALEVAKKRGMLTKQIALCNSADTAGTKERVVGYGAFHIYDPFPFELTDKKKNILLQYARQAIAEGLKKNTKFTVSLDHVDSFLRRSYATFVTCEIDNQLRGCRGELQSNKALIHGVIYNAQQAAFNDPRFAPLTLAEFEKCRLKISILSPLRRLHVESEKKLIEFLQLHKTGLIIKDTDHQATFLPSVWEQIPDAVTFVTHLKKKAGLAVDYWSDSCEFMIYTSMYISE